MGDDLEITPEVIPTESGWADPDDLVEDLTRDVKLPILGKRVRIRVLADVEIAEMGQIPDLARFSELMMELAMLEPVSDELPEAERDRIEAERKEKTRAADTERAHYMVALAHRCVVPHDLEDYDPVLCDDCGSVHPPGLWTLRQTRRLQIPDLVLIANVAEDVATLERVRPFSGDQTDSDSSPPVDSGESTPPTNSDSAVSSTDT
jgi:hypothetical protein